MRLAAVWCKVVGGSETAEAPKCYDYALRGYRELWVFMTARYGKGVSVLLGRMDTPVVQGGSVTARVPLRKPLPQYH